MTSQNIYDTICQRRYMEIRYSGIGENISQNDSYVTCDAIEVQHLGEISEKWGTLGDQKMVYS